MSRLLLFARDPGGANTIIPLVRPLRERGHEVLLYGKDTALTKYRHAGLEATALAGDAEAIHDFVARVAPDVIVTGTSADDFTERHLWRAGARLDVQSLAILDQWVNYGIRFSELGVADIQRYEIERAHPFLPTRIAAPDDFALGEMIAAGLPADRLVVCGQPYFETVRAGSTNGVAKTEGINQDDFVILFASEPITEMFGDAGTWGYTELTILGSLIRALEELGGKRDLVLVVRPHPKEARAKLAELVDRHELSIVIDDSVDPWPMMLRADLVCGMSSMFLLEAAILRRPVMSIQIGLCRPDPFVLARRGSVRTVTTEAELATRLHRVIVAGEAETVALEVISDPVARVIRVVEELCQR